MILQELHTSPRLFNTRCPHLAWSQELQIFISHRTTRCRTHNIWGGTPCKARLHSK